MPDLIRGVEEAARDSGKHVTVETASALVSAKRAPRLRFSLQRLIGATTVCVCFIAIFTWSFRKADRSSLASEIHTELLLIEYAIAQYAADYGALPPAVKTDKNGKPLSSWRFQIYPPPHFSHRLPHDLDASWDADVNRPVGRLTFCCFKPGTRTPQTDVFGIVGPDTAFDRSRAKRPGDLPADIVLAMEVADSKTHWMQPGDYDVTKLLAATGKLGDTVKGLLRDRVHVLFADGEVWALSPDMPMDVLKPFLTIAAAKTASRDEVLTPYRVD
jgi:hypothetical protein